MTTNRSITPGVVIPELPYRDVREAAEWLCRAFGFVERLRIGEQRAQLSFGVGSIVVARLDGESGPSVSVMVRVTDIDNHYEHARQFGVRVIHPPADYSYGERQYTAEDPGGHRWTFSQTIADIDRQTWGGILFK